MKVRGTRECQSCGSQWSYYETGSVECPECGSMQSVGVDDERQLHTARAATLDLAPIHAAIDSEPIRRLAERALETARSFTRGYGFIDGGELQPLDDTYLAAMELRMVADAVGRTSRLNDEEEHYFFTLLGGADDGEHPPASAVPDSLSGSRGLAYATAVDAYREDLRTYLDEHPDDAAAAALSRLRNHVKRALALDGEIPVADADKLVAVTRAIGQYLIENDETALTTANARLDALA